eukprot:5295685-Alexandrium_andersonii.AAC.1
MKSTGCSDGIPEPVLIAPSAVFAVFAPMLPTARPRPDAFGRRGQMRSVVSPPDSHSSSLIRCCLRSPFSLTQGRFESFCALRRGASHLGRLMLSACVPHPSDASRYAEA